MNRLSRFALSLGVALPSLALASTWNIDPMHSSSGFAVKHMVVSTVRGTFGKTTGTVNLDEKDVTRSSVEATIDTTTVDTGVAPRDNDLRSANFFDVAQYPTITFKSTKVQRAGKGKLKVTGNLTMHGVTKPVVLEVEGPTQAITDPQGHTRRAFSATTRLNRKDFGLSYSKMIEAGPVVGDQVQVQLEMEMVKAGDSEQAEN